MTTLIVHTETERILVIVPTLRERLAEPALLAEAKEHAIESMTKKAAGFSLLVVDAGNGIVDNDPGVVGGIDLSARGMIALRFYGSAVR